MHAATLPRIYFSGDWKERKLRLPLPLANFALFQHAWLPSDLHELLLQVPRRSVAMSKVGARLRMRCGCYAAAARMLTSCPLCPFCSPRTTPTSAAEASPAAAQAGREDRPLTAQPPLYNTTATRTRRRTAMASRSQRECCLGSSSVGPPSACRRIRLITSTLALQDEQVPIHEGCRPKVPQERQV